MTDAELIEASRRGDRDAYGALVERHQRMVEAIAYAAAGDRAIVDDVVQDVFVAAWLDLERLRDDARLRPWLCGIAMNVARKARRRRVREAAPIDVAGHETPFEAADERERARAVTAALAGLSPRYREPLVLFYYEHCSVKEVAAALAIREDTAMQRLSRGRRQLGDALAARVEESLERRPSRKAIAAAVLAVLPLVRPRGALAAVIDAAARGLVAMTARGRAVIRAIIARWRLAAAMFATAAIALILVDAIETSERVAAAQAARESAAAPAHAAEHVEAPRAPHLPVPSSSTSDGQIHRSIVVASTDPVETCRRGMRGLVVNALDYYPLVKENGELLYRPDPAMERLVDDLGDRFAETCAGQPWPELYAICEGTTMDALDGTVTCYPYSPFE